MAALESHFMDILKRVLSDRFVPFLPPLLDKSQPPEKQHAKQLSRAFSAFVIHKLFDADPKTASASVVDDFYDQGIDAIYYDAKHETLYLLQTKFKASEQFKLSEAQAFCSGVRLLLKQDFSDFNDNVTNRKSEIEEALDACSHIRLVVPYTGDGVTGTANDELLKLINGDNLDDERVCKNVQYYTAAEIVHDLLEEQSYPPVNTRIALQKYSKIAEPRPTYYGIARLEDLVNLHHEHGKALYERNIRYFLGSQSAVNKAIKTTLHEAPDNFFYLNNGVTAVCDLIEQKGLGPREQFRNFDVRGLSVINGAQTVASVAEFHAEHPDRDISSAKIMMTLIKAPSKGDFGKQVTRARNHQNPVSLANFASLDGNQERLRQEIACLGYNYHYRPESNTAESPSITLSEALKALATLHNDPRYPAWLKREPTRLNNPDGNEYQVLMPTTLTGPKLVNAILCHRAIRKLIVGYENSAPSRSREKLVYRHATHVMIAVVMKRLRKQIDSASVMDAGRIPNTISLPLDELRQLTTDMSSNKIQAQGPLAYFKNQSNVVAFLADLSISYYELSEDPAVQNLRNTTGSGEAYPRQRLFDYLSSHAPQLQEPAS